MGITLDKTKRAEFLRTPETVCQPDPRNESPGFAASGVPCGGKEFEGHHHAIAAIGLHAGVPEDIVIQYETAKNIYLYAWFVYRFYPVAKGQAYVCLEFALRERLEQEMLNAGWKRQRFGFTLRNYLEYAAKNGYIRNEDFEVWRHKVRLRARERHEFKTIQEMRRLGLTEMAIDDSAIEISEEDRSYDYLGIILDTIPQLRNHYAHGGNALHKQVLGTFRTVSEIINRLWSDPGGQ